MMMMMIFSHQFPYIPDSHHEDMRDLKQRLRRPWTRTSEKIVLISKTLALHVHYKLWYISLSSSAKQ